MLWRPLRYRISFLAITRCVGPGLLMYLLITDTAQDFLEKYVLADRGNCQPVLGIL